MFQTHAETLLHSLIISPIRPCEDSVGVVTEELSPSWVGWSTDLDLRSLKLPFSKWMSLAVLCSGSDEKDEKATHSEVPLADVMKHVTLKINVHLIKICLVSRVPGVV